MQCVVLRSCRVSVVAVTAGSLCQYVTIDRTNRLLKVRNTLRDLYVLDYNMCYNAQLEVNSD